MKLLTLHDPRTASDSLTAATLIGAACMQKGHEVLSLSIASRLLETMLDAISPVQEIVSDAVDKAADIAAITNFAPDVLVVETNVNDQAPIAAKLAPYTPDFLSIYTLHLRKDAKIQLVNLSSGKIFIQPSDAYDRLAAIIASEAAANSRAPIATIDTSNPAFTDLARAQIALQRYASVLPYRASELSQPTKITCAGALESLGNEEIILDRSLWIKGWIDWDEKQFSHLVATIDTREHTIPLTEFRGDKYTLGTVETPMGFEAQIDLNNLFSLNTLTLHVQDKTGRRWQWCTREMWISQDTPSQSVTPLITGQVLMDGTARIAFSVACDGGQIRRVLAWQGGACIGRWDGDESSTSQEMEIFPIRADEGATSDALVHLHVFLEGTGFVPWLCLSPETGDLAQATQIDRFHVIEDGFFTPDLKDFAANAFPVTILCDGKLVQILSRAQPCRISLDDCAGMATVEAICAHGTRQSWRLWRHCRDAGEGRTLPAFVMPPKSALTPAPQNTDKPHILLLRPTSAPTDELYLLCALEQISTTRDFDLDIIDLQDDDSTILSRKALLRPGTFVIISRYLSADWIETLSRAQATLGGIYYIMDDDVTLAQNDIRMPGGYRRRMIGVAHSEFQTLLHLSSHFLVTSRFLAERFASAKTNLITPPYIRPVQNLDHLDDMSEIRIEYHGTQVHRADLDAIASALVWIHNTYPQVRIRTYMGKFAPNRFRTCERIEIVPDIPWEDYKSAVAASPAHIALAPMLESPYNKAKSFVKIMDIARLGAAGLYSRRAPYDDVITHGEDGLLLENDPLIWRYALAWLIENPDKIRRLATAGQQMTHCLGDVNILSQYWEGQLFDCSREWDAI